MWKLIYKGGGGGGGGRTVEMRTYVWNYWSLTCADRTSP